jgi:hypothetical protein
MTTKAKCLRILAPVLIVGAFFIGGTSAAFAADTPVAVTPTVAATPTETLTVDDVWLTDDTLRIAVTDGAGGSQTLELNLSDYAKSGDEYVTIQATDSGGRVSNAVQFKNPYYVPAEENTDNDGENGGNANTPADAAVEHNALSESAVSEDGKLAGDGRPFTPDGTGSVIDNASEGDGKEFFTVETADGNVFYLIVDRQRNAENVYLLNAVTEDDLSSLAKPGNGKTDTPESAVTVPETANTPAPTPEATPEPTPEPAKSGGNTGMIGIMIVVLIVVGGAGYYFKIVRPKKNGGDYETEDEGDAETGEDYAVPREEESFDYNTSDEERKVEESEVDGE